MALASVRVFRGLQEERVGLYRSFEEGFAAYLKAAPNLDFNAYKRLVYELSREFNRVSQLIICEKEALKTVHGREELASTLEKIQEEEASKLEMTAAYQIARQTLTEHRMTTTTTTTTPPKKDEDRDEEMTRREISELKKKMAENEAAINELLEELKYQSEDLYEREEEDEEEEEETRRKEVEGMEERCGVVERGFAAVDAVDVHIEMEEELSR